MPCRKNKKKKKKAYRPQKLPISTLSATYQHRIHFHNHYKFFYFIFPTLYSGSGMDPDLSWQLEEV